MSFVKEFEEKATPFEKKYMEFLEKTKQPENRSEMSAKILKQDLVDREKVDLSAEFKPNEGFVKSYNERYVKNKVQETKQNSRGIFNEEGKRFARTWDYKSFEEIHDPLGK
jgi:hypothetical protein